MRRHRPRSRGAALVEAAILMPMLVLLFGGIVEYGMAWRASARLATVTRAGALEASRDPDRRLADLEVMQRMRSGLGGSAFDSIEHLVVYRVAGTDAGVPPSCLAVAATLQAGAGGVQDLCNVYSGSFVAGATSESFASSTCGGDPDRWLCPSSRRSVFGPADRLGVAVIVRHRWVTGLLPGGGITLDDRGVAMLAPPLNGAP